MYLPSLACSVKPSDSDGGDPTILVGHAGRDDAHQGEKAPSGSNGYAPGTDAVSRSAIGLP
jgi:hypothetical protein